MLRTFQPLVSLHIGPTPVLVQDTAILVQNQMWGRKVPLVSETLERQKTTVLFEPCRSPHGQT